MRFALDGRVRDRIIAETRGNPLALLELPRGLTPTQLAGGFGMPEARDVSQRIEQTYIRRVTDLSKDARRLLLVAAADPVGDPLLCNAACERLGIALSAVEATDGLLTVDERVTFRHPLARSAVYRSADGPERRAAHSALAEVTIRNVDPDRRAWHLALLPLQSLTRRSRTSWSSRQAGQAPVAVSRPLPRSSSGQSR